MADTPQEYGKYQLLMRLATGGQGEIFLAQLDGMAGFVKQVVIKRLLPHLAADIEFVNMLLDEARIVSRLSHPNVCQVYELGRVERSYYMAMEYLEGVSLSRVLRHAVDHLMLLDVRLICAILRQACEGLHHAHELRDATGVPIELVHRDVSPSNLFVTMDGLTKVLDFGIAKARGSLSKTRTGAIKGKYEYMSPEQVLRRPLDRRSDVFSLGIVLFEALTLKRLFYRGSEYEVFRAITEEPIPALREHRCDVPPALDRVVARALARDLQERFASARELGQALMEATTSLGPPLTEVELGEYVRAHFGQELDMRRAALRVTAAPLEPEGVEPLSPPDSPATSTGTAPTPEPLPQPAAAPLVRPVEPRSGWSPAVRWLVAIGAIVLAGIAGIVGALLYHASEPVPPAPVLVVAGEVTAEDGTPMTLAAAPGSAAEDPYVTAFSAHRAEVERCMSGALLTMDQLGRPVIAFTVNRDGRVEDVSIEPVSLAETPLGDCLRAAAMKTSFGQQKRDRVLVRIPLRPRTP